MTCCPRANRAELIRRELKTVFRSSALSSSFDELSDEELLAHARSLQEGVAFATPVFDGAQEQEIKEYLEKAELPKSGKD